MKLATFVAGDHYRSSIWMQQALRKWNDEEAEEKSVSKAEILEYLAFSLYAQGNMRRALRQDLKIIVRFRSPRFGYKHRGTKTNLC